MQKKFILFLLTGLVFLFISCPFDCTPEEIKVRGKDIDNLPEWTKDTLASEWKLWNTAETAEFKKIIQAKRKPEFRRYKLQAVCYRTESSFIF